MMDFIITFFRDILDGPLYIVIAVISGILICSCIGYLAERSIMRKKEKEQYDKEHFNVEESVAQEVQIEEKEVSLNEISESQDPMETVQIENNMDSSIVQQAIPEMTNVSDDGSHQENMSVNQTQNIDK